MTISVDQYSILETKRKSGMKKILILLFLCSITITFYEQAHAQSDRNKKTSTYPIVTETDQLVYAAHPNHREIVIKSFELAVMAGFIDPSGLTVQEIKDRLEAGAYSEDFESIPGIIGEHFPAPWNQGPEFDFFGYYPFSKIPYDSYRDTLSGWYRGLNHGYDPVQDFKWPGANSTTVDWANSSLNSYIWNKAVELYRDSNYLEAYQCLGHILHLLADLSIPSHVKVVNHGMDVVELKSGTPINPDKLELIIDEYELALAGGLNVPGYIFIPDKYSVFQSATDIAKIDNIPYFFNWKDYLVELGKYSYNHPLVNQFYIAPIQNGGWGAALNENGEIVNPTTYVTLPLVEINGEWFELKLKSTATSSGTILPESKMNDICNDLVPKAIEYGAGLLMKFFYVLTDVESEQNLPEGFILNQNYPNPFNPSTKISWQVPQGSWQSLKIYDVLGNEVATLVNEYQSVGTYEVEFIASGFPSGIYFYQLQSGEFVETKKMILLK